MKKNTFNIIIEKGLDGYLLSSVIELPGCHTQAKTYESLLKRTKEAIELYLEESKGQNKNVEFLSLHQLTL